MQSVGVREIEGDPDYYQLLYLASPSEIVLTSSRVTQDIIFEII